MLQISDSVIANLIDADKKVGIFKFINERRFTVGDIPKDYKLTYRQVNSLGKDNLLDDKRKNKKGWRKFSFKDLLYLLKVAEVKKFGLKHEQLHELWYAFFGEKKMMGGSYAELAIGCVFGHTQILVTIGSSGNVVFYDPILYSLHSYSEKRPQITFELNFFVNYLLKKIGREEFIPKFTLTSEFAKSFTSDLTKKEKELVTIIRDDNFKSIKVKKRDGEMEVVNAETANEANSLSPRDVLDVIIESFQDINIVKRNGKIVNLTVEETIKL